MSEDNDEYKESSNKELIFEDVISKALTIPGVKVNRSKFLADQFASKVDDLNKIIEVGPVEYGITREEISRMTKKLIIQRTSQSSLASFAAGIPGGIAMAATIPADILQFFGMTLRLAQEISYMYGAEDLWVGDQIDDEKVMNQLILYCGVMFGASTAVSGVRVFSVQLSKTALKQIPKKALTKTFWYPIVKKVLGQMSIKITKDTFAKSVSKAIPVVGGVVSGTINFASLMPMANRLKNTFDKSIFDYSEEEFNKDLEVVLNPDQFEKKEKDSNQETTKKNKKFSFKFKKEKNKKEDPYEELKKLKELLDSDIITQEEFEKKKKQLLDL